MELKVEYVFPCVVCCFVLYSFIRQHIEKKKNDSKKINKKLDEVEYKVHSIAYELGLESLPPADLSVNYIREYKKINKSLEKGNKMFNIEEKRLDEVEYQVNLIAYELGLKSLPPADLSVNYIRE